MAGVAYNGSVTNDCTANDITYEYFVPRTCGNSTSGYYDCSYWQSAGGSSTIHGTVVSSHDVFINGKPISIIGDSVTETETYSFSGTIRNVRNAQGGTGHIAVGNPNNVYVNGISVATIGSTVQTHTTPTTTVRDGSLNVFIGG